MKLCGALAFLIGIIGLYTVDGLRCFTCTATEPRSCTDTKSCPVIFNRCFSLRFDGYDLVTKGCQTSIACGGAIACCEGDLCNHGMKHAGPSAVLLLLLATAAVLFSSS